MMDFLDPKKKRAYNIRLAIGFVLIAVLLLLGTTILAFITAGYGITSKGKVIQNGLVFLNSQPVSANIYINGVASGTTNARLELASGNYTFTLKASGYHNWSTTTNVFGGTVEQLVYPFLFPTKPVQSKTQTLSAQPQVATESPDRHWMIASVPGDNSTFSIIDLTNPKTPITTATIPASVLANQPGTNNFSFVEWSTDNHNVLLQDNYQGGVSYIMFNWNTPASSYNVNQTFNGTTFSSIQLVNKSASKLYLYNSADNSLVMGVASTKVITPVLSNVLAYWPYGTDQIVYTTPDSGDPTHVQAMLYNAGTSYQLRDLPVASTYQLNMATYNGNTYVITGSSSSDYAYIYLNPMSTLKGSPNKLPLPYTLLVSSGTPENVTFSNSARFIALQSGSQIAVYDIQSDTHYRYDTGLTLSQSELADWMDGNRMTLISGDRLNVFDFDGTNMVNFVSANDAYMPAFNTGYNAVYTVIPLPGSTTGQWEIVRNSLIADKS